MYRLAVLVIAMVMMAGGGAARENLSPQEFTDAVATAATAAMPAAKITVAGALQIDSRDAHGATTTTDLGNAYQLYVRDPQHLDELIQRCLGVLADTIRHADAEPTPDRSRIVPILKTRRWVEELRQASNTRDKAEPAPEPLTEPFNAELMIVYVEDRPSSMRFLTTRDDVGDRTQLHDLALDNLKRLLSRIKMHAAADGVFLVSAGGNYEASLLLIDGFWLSGQIKVDGDFVVAVPAKDALILTGSNNQAGIARLRAVAADIAAGPYALTSTLFVYRDGKFVTFDGK